MSETAGEAARQSRQVVHERELLAMTNARLDELFRRSPAGDIPRGDTLGTVVLFTGSPLAPIVAAVSRALFWQGKVFSSDGRWLANKVGPFGLRLIHAAVFPADSWVDGGECVVLDYSATSRVARWIRDEIRLVAPQLYLGVVWVLRRRVGYFALRTPVNTGSGSSVDTSERPHG